MQGPYFKVLGNAAGRPKHMLTSTLS